jgi:ABC-2 type transport system permease protein
MIEFRKALLPVFTFARISVRRAFRDKTALFFIFLFPLIFLFVFGGIFGRSSDVSFKLAVIDQSQTDFSRQLVGQLKDNKIFKVDSAITGFEVAKQKMSRGQLDATIILPQGFGQLQPAGYPGGQAKLYYTQNSAEAARTLTSVLGFVFTDINKQFVQAAVPFSVVSEELNTKSLTSFDYIFAGLLGFSIIGIGIFGPATYFPELKKQGVLRRLHTTPLRVWQYFTATVLSQVFIGLLNVLLMFAVAVTVYDLRVAGNALELAIFVTLSIAMILGIGLALGGWARNERQAAPLANLVVFPMMFLSGTFFPRFLMPEWLQQVSAFLPLTPVIDGIRLIATEGAHLVNILPQLGAVAGWLVVIYAIAFRVFRWE